MQAVYNVKRLSNNLMNIVKIMLGHNSLLDIRIFLITRHLFYNT